MRKPIVLGMVFLGLGVGLGLALGTPPQVPKTDSQREYDVEPVGKTYLKQGAGVIVPTGDYDYELGSNHVSKLKPYPECYPGARTPLNIWEYAGKGESSWGSPQLNMPWEKWVEHHREMKPKIMADVRDYMTQRFDFHGKTVPGQMMSGQRKGVPLGPVARLPETVPDWDALAALSPEEIREKDLFPYKPLAHPSHSTAHMLFPKMWVEVHPEHERIDIDFDIPESYLPEFPPPMYLTTHKELGDVTNGREVTLGNYYEIFDGLCTPEQMEGLKELLRPTPTTWFNHTTHRVTMEPSAGVGCFGCHVNGHTNAAIELAPDSRPNQARLRVDTPTIRGN
ncbi:MAG: hypothetical protein KDA84_24600, partial [Planctomycetaceae bacterium]|nr:hypothetical protein [Planctomycetaceae bacterium]